MYNFPPPTPEQKLKEMGRNLWRYGMEDDGLYQFSPIAQPTPNEFEGGTRLALYCWDTWIERMED